MSYNFENIGILYNPHHKEAKEIVDKLSQELCHYGIKYQSQELNCLKFNGINEYFKHTNINIIVGGDGTLLSASRFFAPLDIPLLGVNSGNLGFLSQLCKQKISIGIKRLFNHDFHIEERLMLQAGKSLEESSNQFYALNDIVIKRGAISTPIQLSVFVENIKVNDFLGDGLIISTPTGSTAYNLSVGGPILSPSMDALIISPIASHSLAMRPLVVSDKQVIKIVISNESKNIYLSADYQEHISLTKENVIYVKRSPYKIKLILLGQDKDNFFNILRSKLHWGIFPGAKFD